MKIRKLRWTLLASAVPVVALAASCNLVINTDPKGCETDEECVNFPNTGCQEGLCVSLDTCSSNADCADDSICRPVQPRSCQPVKQGNCQEVYPADDTYRDEKAIFIGVTAPLSEDPSTGFSIVNGAKLGVDQFNKDGGIAGDRPIVLIICDDHAEAEDAYQNGLSIANIGAQVLIGPAYSGQTLETAGTTTKPGTVANNVLLVSPSATSPLITGITDRSPRCVQNCFGDATCESACPGLVWRTSPSDNFQGTAIATYVGEIEELIKKRGNVTPARDTIVGYELYKPDAYGDLLSDVIRTKLKINGASAASQQNENFFRVDYEDVDEADGIQPNQGKITDAIGMQPDLVFLIGTDEVADILTRFETEWPGGAADRPYYIFGDGGLSTAVATAVANAGAEDRVRGTVPGPPQLDSENYTSFDAAYRDKFPTGDGGPQIFGAAGAYDTIFLVAYSVVAAGTAPITAEQIALGFARVADTSATVSNARKPEIGDAVNALTNGANINFEGASGSLDFDLVTGEAPAAIQVWCVESATNPVTSNHYWTASADDPEGPGVMAGHPEPQDTGATFDVTLPYQCPYDP